MFHSDSTAGKREGRTLMAALCLLLLCACRKGVPEAQPDGEQELAQFYQDMVRSCAQRKVDIAREYVARGLESAAPAPRVELELEPQVTTETRGMDPGAGIVSRPEPGFEGQLQVEESTLAPDPPARPARIVLVPEYVPGQSAEADQALLQVDQVLEKLQQAWRSYQQAPETRDALLQELELTRALCLE